MALCACGCGKEMVIKPIHKYYGTPKYIKGHNTNKGLITRFIEENQGKHFCHCPCKGTIKISWHHYYKGIPKYINTHHLKIKGPFSGRHHTEESKNKIREHYPDTFGENNPFYGRRHTEEAKQKNREKHLGKGDTEETRKKKSIARTKENNCMYGKHHTEEAKQKNREKHLGKPGWSKGLTKENDRRVKKISEGLKGILPSPRVLTFGWCYYDSPLQGRIRLRSTYELAYAKYLDEHNILWMYEMETFGIGDTTYTPDFFLPQFETFIEIKGYMRNENKLKINKFREEYPWILKILYRNDLIKLGCEIK